VLLKVLACLRLHISFPSLALGCHVGDLIWGAAAAGGTLDALQFKQQKEARVDVDAMACAGVGFKPKTRIMLSLKLRAAVYSPMGLTLAVD
jgi:hypothetical protein